MAFITSRIMAGLSIATRRNFGTSYILLAKGSDPIQQLFLDKLSEFSAKMNDKNFIQDNPDLKKRLDDELNRVTSQYGGSKPADLEDFPKLLINEPVIEIQPDLSN